MSRALVFVGVSQRNSSIEARERLSLTHAQARALAGRIAARPGIDEAFVVSTCERTELYALAAATPIGQAVLREQLDELAGPLGSTPPGPPGPRPATDLIRGG